MSRRQKLLDKAKNNRKGLSFDEFETLLSLYDWIFDHLNRCLHRDK